jgi:ABC-type Na+ transport system ATPase subunit NatA
MLEVDALTKRFGATLAVDGLSFKAEPGRVLGFLGPNGAGKTTTVRMLATLLRPDAGSARVLGHDIVSEAHAVRSVVSLTGQLASVDEDLTGRENLVLLGRLLGLKRPQAKWRAAELLEAFGLAEAAGRLVKNYSGGMRRRLDIAASIVVTPDLLFLDEPTTGLDPRSRNQVWDIVRALVADGTTVLLTTQYLDEADQLAGRIAVTLWAAISLNFFIPRLLPGDPFAILMAKLQRAGGIPAGTENSIRLLLGAAEDQTLWEQYVTYWRNVLTGEAVTAAGEELPLARSPSWIRTYMRTIGAIDGNIIALIITTHTVSQQPSVPGSVPGPMSMPRI